MTAAPVFAFYVPDVGNACSVEDRLRAAPIVVDFAAAVPGTVAVEAIYAAGSLASGDYQAASSDLDLVAVVVAALTPGQRTHLRRFHQSFQRDHPSAAKLHCTYPPRQQTTDPSRRM